MPKLNRKKVTDVTLYLVLVAYFFSLGASLYLEATKRGMSAGDTAFVMGLATAVSFCVGYLLMYAVHTMKFAVIEVDFEMLVKEFNRLNEKLDKCAKECLCAADAYLYLLLAGIYIDGIRRSVEA
jgi:hypothetical protein